MDGEQMAREAGNDRWEGEGEATGTGIDASVIAQRDASAVAEAVASVLSVYDIFDATATTEWTRRADERAGRDN